MTKEEALGKLKEINREWIRRAKEIRNKAEEQGRLLPGLDANRDLTAALDEEMKTRIQKLAEELDDGEG